VKVKMVIWSTPRCMPCELLYRYVKQISEHIEVEKVIDTNKRFREYPVWEIFFDGELVFRHSGFREEYVYYLVKSIDLAAESGSLDKLKPVLLLELNGKLFISPVILKSVVENNFRCPCRSNDPCPCDEVSEVIEGKKPYCGCRLYYRDERKLWEDLNSYFNT